MVISKFTFLWTSRTISIHMILRYYGEVDKIIGLNHQSLLSLQSWTNYAFEESELYIKFHPYFSWGFCAFLIDDALLQLCFDDTVFISYLSVLGRELLFFDDVITDGTRIFLLVHLHLERRSTDWNSFRNFAAWNKTMKEISQITC